LNNTQMSAAGIFAIGVPSDAFTTTFNRAQFLNTCAPSLFGQVRAQCRAPAAGTVKVAEYDGKFPFAGTAVQFAGAPVPDTPSQGVVKLPACGTK
jgi:hypothetical protein